MKHTIMLACFLLVLPAIKTSAQKKKVVTTLNDKTTALTNEDANSLSALFHEKAVINLYPQEEVASGIDEINTYYNTQFFSTEILSIKLVERMAFKGMVIDKELVKTKEKSKERIVFYKFKKNKIKTMTIIEGGIGSQNSQGATRIVDVQLAAYNRRNLNAFLNTYAEDVTTYKFPDKLNEEGHNGLKRDYTGLFEKNTDLNCKIEKRMALGSIVIDKELITASGNRYKAIAIYEVTNGKISSVRFIQ